MSPSPALPPPDPWTALAAALRGRPPGLPAPGATGEAALVAAHLHLLRGEPDAARAALARAGACPGAAPLARRLGLPAPLPGDGGAPWQQADAQVDLAAAAVEAGRPGPARAALAEARARVPDHAEATLLLAALPGPLPAELRPRLDLGGLSPERIRRRLHPGGWGPRPGPGGPAGLLVDPGGDRALARALDEVLGRRRLGLPTDEALRRTWALARRAQGVPLPAVAAWIVAVGAQEPGAGAVVRAAAEVLQRLGPGPAGRAPAARRPVGAA